MNAARHTDPDTRLHDDHLGPNITDADALLALFADPADAGRRACAWREVGFQSHIWVRPAPPLATDARAQILRGPLAFDPSVSAPPVSPDMSPATAPRATDPNHPPGPDVPVPPDMPPGPGPDGPQDPTDPSAPHPGAPGWPDPHAVQRGDRLVLRVDQDELPAYCAWLVRAATALPAGTSVAPYSPRPGGLFRLHLIAAARLALPLSVRVEVRHDLIGVRLAQVALGFGADTLAGPQDSGRHLPLAAIPRPSETSQAALCELVRQAGLEATTHAPERTQR
jgi:hypothetical protein